MSSWPPRSSFPGTQLNTHFAPLPSPRSCVRYKRLAIPTYPFAYDPDGDELKYEIRTLPEDGQLYEENLKSELPEADHRSTPIISTDLPFAQTEFNSPHISYVHTPSDPFNFNPRDSFVVAYTDGMNWTEVTISINILSFNTLPIVEPSYNATSTVGVEEDQSVSTTLNFVDYDSSVVTLIAEELPKHGHLSYTANGETKIVSTFVFADPYGDQVPESQYAKEVIGFSSTWYNEKGDWAPNQILGEQSTFIYADSTLAWCPEVRRQSPNSRIFAQHLISSHRISRNQTLTLTCIHP